MFQTMISMMSLLDWVMTVVSVLILILTLVIIIFDLPKKIADSHVGKVFKPLGRFYDNTMSGKGNK